MKKQDIALNNVKEFISSLDLQEGWGEDTIRFFQHADVGELQLNYKQAIGYNKCLEKLMEAFVKNENMSRKSVDKALQKTILKAINTHDPSTLLEDRTEEAIEELKNELNRKPTLYKCYIPIRGLKEEGLPKTIGAVKFCAFDVLQIEQFKDAISHHTVQQDDKLLFFDKLMDQTDLKNAICGVLNVNAKDAESAQFLAIKQLRQTLNILNFFGKFLAPKAWCYLPGDLEVHNFGTPILNEDNSYYFPTSLVGPTTDLSISQVINFDAKNRIGFEYVINLLNQQKPTKIDKSLLTALHWAGRAAIVNQREESFLLYAIALESIILADNPNTELSYRLRIRVAHLLSNDPDSRQNIYNHVKKLYNLRSKIVHDGHYEITDIDLRLLSTIVNQCLIKFCSDSEYQAINSFEDLANWFQKQVFAS